MFELGNTFISGNGNGNKFNLRIEILENLLKSAGDGSSAKVNSLRQAIRRNKTDMADNTPDSLDLLRQIFQPEMNEEIKQILDRYVRTTFAPAFENLRRNGHDVSQKDINQLCISILDGAKEPFLPEIKVIPPNLCISAQSVMKNRKPELQVHEMRKLYDSDENESDGSLVSHNSILSSAVPGSCSAEHGMIRPKKRGRPRKIDVDSGRCGTPIMHGTQPVTYAEAYKWNPDRVTFESRFILGSKVNKILGLGHRGHIFVKYPRIFRYVGDDEDKAWLFDRNYSTRMSGKVFFMLLEDVIELARYENTSPHVYADLQRYSFVVHEKILHKIKSKMFIPFGQLKQRITTPHQQQISHPPPPPPQLLVPPNIPMLSNTASHFSSNFSF
uniref:DNTTIP1 dimerisation domain-containing protein n=1 Tax=Acrobeloides nanus TaxID=290746 RepID=A0A914C0Q0_9BILA